MRRNLLNLIHGYYLEAFSRLPPGLLRATLAHGVLVGGHCFGRLRPPHNIIVNAVWYAAAFPHPAATDDGDGGDDVRAVLPTDGIARICHRSLEGLVAALRHYCPSVSAADALYHLMDANADLGSAIALANGTSKSSALRVMAPRNLVAFQLAAEAARHPNPAAFAHFASALPTINAKNSLLQHLLINYMLSPGNIDHLTNVLVPELPDEPPLPPPTIRPRVLDCISSQKQQFKDTGRRVLDVVNMASQHYTLQTGEQLVLHSVSGASLVNEEEEGLSNCYYQINFLANRKYPDSALGFPVVLFTEATVLAHDEICINLCVIVDPAKEIVSCFA
ncbi:uncharacterized protein [Miscanthus floridulus]|uniref:uncharacterized protein n=1 Tax=Miscanthus floridulus TaxID=154761 RepID=UPI00345B1F86